MIPASNSIADCVTELERLRHEYGGASQAVSEAKQRSLKANHHTEGIRNVLMKEQIGEPVNKREIIAEANPEFKKWSLLSLKADCELIAAQAKLDEIRVNIDILRTITSATKVEMNFQ